MNRLSVLRLLSIEPRTMKTVASFALAFVAGARGSAPPADFQRPNEFDRSYAVEPSAKGPSPAELVADEHLPLAFSW